MLKKLIVIMAVLALVAGTAFAQATFGGQLQLGIDLLKGSNVGDVPVKSGASYSDGPYHEAKYSVVFGDGKANGRLVLLAKGDYWGWLKWRPNEHVQLKLGKDGDGEFGFPQIVGWGFTGEAKNSVAAVNDYNGRLSMKNRGGTGGYGGFDGSAGFSFIAAFWPVDMLQVYIGFPGIDNEAEITERLAKAHLGLKFDIEEVGTIRFAAVGAGALAKDAPAGSAGTLHLTFYSNKLVQGFAFEVGTQIPLPYNDDNDNMIQSPLDAGFGINLTSTDPFSLKVRANANFGGKNAAGVESDPVIGIGVLPSYKLPKMTIFFHAGLGYMITDNENIMSLDWFINPYIWVPMGGMRMWVGIQVINAYNPANSASQKGQIDWKLPFGFNFYF